MSGRKCRKCCDVWLRSRDGVVQHGCPHCYRVTSTHEEPDEVLGARQVKHSLEAHAKVCPIAVRTAVHVAGTGVEPAQSRVESGRDERWRYRR